jgi:DNA-binding NarL/FixJ family response regulator
MPEPILIVVEDLIFLAKIQHTAQELGIAVETVPLAQLPERLSRSPSAAVIVDLNHRSGSAVETVRALKADAATAQAHLLGFLSHVQGELAHAARQARCDQVLARSAFSEQLPELLARLAGR